MNKEKLIGPKLPFILTFFQFAAFAEICARFVVFWLVLRGAICKARTKEQTINVFGPSHFGWVKISPNSFAGAMHHPKLEKIYGFWRFVRLACSRNLWSFFKMWYDLHTHQKNATNEATGYNIVALVYNFLRLHKPHATGCFDKPVHPMMPPYKYWPVVGDIMGRPGRIVLERAKWMNWELHYSSILLPYTAIMFSGRRKIFMEPDAT